MWVVAEEKAGVSASSMRLLDPSVCVGHFFNPDALQGASRSVAAARGVDVCC